MSDIPTQATTAMPVLMPALVPAPFDYLVPVGTPEGALVEATLAGRKLIGVVWKKNPEGDLAPFAASRLTPAASGSLTLHSPDPAAKNKKSFTLKPITRVLDHLPPLSQPYRRWIDWIAEFTLAPKGAVLSLCGLSHAAKTPKKPHPPQQFTVTLPELTPQQRSVLEGLGIEDWRLARGDDYQRVTGGEPGVSSAAAKGLDASYKPILLDGVTGSGKTEIYFHAMAQVLGTPLTVHSGVRRAAAEPLTAGASEAKGTRSPLQILVLLPEIALTHQWLARFEKTFGVRPVVWHSRMTPVAKARAWQAVACGEVQVVVGARSALFLPFKDLSLIVVDEEHDPSYKQEDGVLYHARDMAIARAHFERIPILLVSATPSLETLENVKSGKYRALHMPSRFGTAGLPDVRLLDLRNDPPERGEFLSPTAKQEMLATLARGEQVLLFLNRRGYAPLLLCRSCGHRFECKSCSAWLVVHGGTTPIPPSQSATHTRSTAFLSCHHCGYREPMPTSCPCCGAGEEMLIPCGPGVERIAEEVREMFGILPPPRMGGGLSERQALPDNGPTPVLTFPLQGEEPPITCRAPSIALLSSDETIAPETWEQIERGDIDILIGTQMVAKGHHFPRLTLVIVVDADTGLSGPDLRAGERTYQLLHQLGGRAGREELSGRVLVQTYLPDHPVMEALVAQDRDRLMTLEAKERKAGGWPPFGQLAAVLLDGKDEQAVRRAGQMLAQSAPQDDRLTVLGPVAAPLSKLRGQYRYRLLVKAKPGVHLQRTLTGWLAGQKFSGVRMKLDVNPYYFL